ncbi:MAG: hypothetical protein ACYS8Z_15690 [Planctomycetota bacterium]|jgi:hypothetical protein
MALTAAEKKRIRRQYDFLTDPNDAAQRQLMYDRLGLKSFEVAEAEADFRRRAGQEKLAEQERLHGAPEVVGREDELMRFTDPEGVKRTFSQKTGAQTAVSFPSEHDLTPSQRERLKLMRGVRHDLATGQLGDYKRQYSPSDQKRIERLFEAESKYATDPDLTEEERQRAFDVIDQKISRVRKLPPTMQEPTAQQKFDAAIVTAPDGKTKGTFDPKTGKFIPLESTKLEQETQKVYDARLQKNIDALRKRNDDMLATDPEERRSDPDLIKEARTMTDNEFGRNTQRQDSNIPELDAAWQTTMADLQIDNKFANRRATEAQMLTAMDQYVKMGIGKDMREVDAKADFLQRWQAAEGGGPFFNLVPKMSATTRNKAQVAMAGTVREDDALSQQYGLRRGEGRVRVIDTDEQIPPEIERVWNKLPEAEWQAVQKALSSGANRLVPIRKRQIPVRNAKGEEGTIPLVELGEALEAGYTVVI